MSCRCPIQPDYCVDEPITTLDCAACTTCVLSMNADSLRTVLAHRDRLIERLHATRSTLMAELFKVPPPAPIEEDDPTHPLEPS